MSQQLTKEAKAKGDCSLWIALHEKDARIARMQSELRKLQREASVLRRECKRRHKETAQ